MRTLLYVAVIIYHVLSIGFNIISLTNTISLSHFSLQVATIGQYRFEDMHQDVSLRTMG